MAKQPHRFLDPANFWLYSLYVVLLSVASSAVLEVLKDALKSTFGNSTFLSMGTTTLVCFLLTFSFWTVCRREFRKRLENSKLTHLRILPKRSIPSRALIALCSPSPSGGRAANAAFVAACYHRATLQHLWLVTSHGGEETAKWVNQEIQQWGVAVHSPVVLDDTSEVDIIRLKVEELRRQAIEGYRIAEQDVICDFTGMHKPVTAGMILACAPKGRRLQYLQGQYGGDGRLRSDVPAVPIEIEIQYEVEPEG